MTPVVLWSAISHLGRQGLQERYQHCEQLAACLVEELCQLDIPAWKHPGAITVVLPRAPKELIDRWDLASDNHWSHVIVVPGVEWDVLSRFLADVRHVYAREN
ncbi:histidine decarboxylase [compost metagenome]